MLKMTLAAVLAALLALSHASPLPANPYDSVCGSTETPQDPLRIDLGYAIYEGFSNSNTSINTWKGIRYAAPPVGPRRFREPQVPAVNRTAPQRAWSDPAACPQSAPQLSNASFLAPLLPTGAASEDCLYLNVFAPKNAHNLPVFVWIHGGGYELGAASTYDPSPLIHTNNGSFIAVVIQYRLGAFGFLSGDEVKHKGALNSGLLDQQLTLHWVQKYIKLFGGDPKRVTIAGESAGAGSVMNHAIAYGGSQGSHLWTNAITASPYIWQYLGYDSPEVLDTYNSFAALAGCGERGGETFECLQSAASSNLTAANEQIASASLLGAFVWRPVIDGEFIQQRPTDALQGRINGQRVLTGNNANDGLIFVPQNITTQGRFVDYLRLYFPRLDDDAIASILDVYHTPNIPDSPSTPKFQTAGDSGPTAVNQSELTTGHQQVANNFNAEVSFICPSYWLASSFEKNGGAAYQYQFSVTPALHAFDVLHYFPSSFFPADPDVAATFQRAYGGFVTTNRPSSWPQKKVESPLMENLNATGGQPVDFNGFTIFVDPGVEPDFRSVDADTWEGKRAERCDFLRSLSDVLLI